MKEAFLYYIWQHRLYNDLELKTTCEENFEVVNPGERNQGSGPDFLNAQIKISGVLWAGNVEIHVQSSDWNVHKYQYDKAYNNVILHVVYENDIHVKNQKSEKVLSFELKGRISPEVQKKYQNLQANCSFIPCEKQLISFDQEAIKTLLKQQLIVERLEAKTSDIKSCLKKTNNDWQAALFFLLAKYFGLKYNRAAMEIWVESFDYKVLTKSQHNKKTIEALFFGQAGFLDQTNQEEDYFKQLRQEYVFLRQKYDLSPCCSTMFKFYGVRPPNYPTIRLAQLASIYYEYQNLFSFLIKITRLENFYPLFDVKIDSYWRKNYHFGKPSSRSFDRKLSKPFINLLLINVILPLKYCYAQQQGKADTKAVLDFLSLLPAEKNSIISSFRQLNFPANNALDSQALIQLKTRYCQVKKCLDCQIGRQLLKRTDII